MGRGLRLKPFIGGIESFRLVVADGQVVTCSRSQNVDLFKLVISGYGLFGVVSSVALRLMPRQKLQRVVKLVNIDDVMQRFEQRIAEGFLFGDCQFALDPASADFLRRVIFSCYKPVDPTTPIPVGQREISEEQWLRLLYLAHADKTKVFEVLFRRVCDDERTDLLVRIHIKRVITRKAITGHSTARCGLGLLGRK